MLLIQPIWKSTEKPGIQDDHYIQYFNQKMICQLFLLVSEYIVTFDFRQAVLFDLWTILLDVEVRELSSGCRSYFFTVSQTVKDCEGNSGIQIIHLTILSSVIMMAPRCRNPWQAQEYFVIIQQRANWATRCDKVI